MKIKEVLLPNGLPVVLAPIEGTRAVTSLFLIGSGAIHEKKNILGVAHFLEHMMFKGTKKRPSKSAVAEELDSMGAKYNAFTGHEITGYYVKAAIQHHERALDVLSDMLLHSLFPEDEIERERGVIIEEMRMNQDTPMRHVSDLFFKLLFSSHPMERNIIGSEESLRAIERDDLVSFYKDGYRAGNSALVIAGAFDEKKTLEWVEHYFGSLSKGGDTSVSSFVADQKKPRVHVEKRPIDQAHLWLGVPGVSLGDDRRFTGEVLGTILGGNMSSRLFLEIREKRGLAYHISSSHEEGRNYGLFFTRAGVETNRLPEAVEAIVGEHKKIKEKPVSEEELQRAKEYIKGSMALSLEESNDLALFLIEQRLLGTGILTIEEIFSKIDSVTVQDVQSLAQELFIAECVNLAVITKDADEKELRTILSTL